MARVDLFAAKPLEKRVLGLFSALEAWCRVTPMNVATIFVLCGPHFVHRAVM
jgi:hypothetical protein